MFAKLVESRRKTECVVHQGVYFVCYICAIAMNLQVGQTSLKGEKIHSDETGPSVSACTASR
jgi:hypothetical protein